MATGLASAVRTSLEAQMPRLLELLRDLVALESPTSDPSLQEPVLQLLSDELASIGMRAEIAEGDWLVAGDHSAMGSMQLLVGHCDTVWPVGTLAEMPFEVDDGHARGPGVYDMKAGLVQLVGALRALFDLGVECEVAPVVFVNSDEEAGSRRSTPTLVDLAARADRALILEPSMGPEGSLKTARKGGGSFIVEVIGKAAHAGLAPGTGSSAILELSLLVQQLFELNDPEAGVSVNVGVIEGGTRSNVVAERAKAVIDVRLARASDGPLLERRIRSLRRTLEGSTVKISGGLGRPPMERTPRNRSLFRIAQHRARELGIEVGAAVAGGTSDGNTTSLYTATLDGLGAVGDGAHSRGEHVLLEEMPLRAALLALLLSEPPVSGRVR